ncbi:N-acetyltransferase [Sphingomonas ginkgonis]|uniref:N-acetyltransferase n=2 Tax=Sphingomonas ginkgonis TaxID=2315330 RepID=A0A429VE79_9SPHN|nr:N-acetyltransferase [Sphingomonas ginkgonis]
MHRIMRDPATMRYWSSLPHESLPVTREWVASMMGSVGDPASDDFIVERNGEVIGKLGCHRLPEVGFLLAADCCGQGLASEGLAAFIAHRRASDGTELTADTDPRNGPSMRLLQRHGFVETGRASRTWLIGTEWCDSIYWRLML